MLVHRRLATVVATAVALLGASALKASATTAGSTTTYYFGGTCGDCTGVSRAELELFDYTPGDDINSMNFVSFHYDGTNLLNGFTISAADDPSYLEGDIDQLPGEDTFAVAAAGKPNFFSSSDGYWCSGVNCGGDYGYLHVWTANPLSVSAAPEPATWALMLAGIGGIGLMLRRAKKTMGFSWRDCLAS